MFKGTKSSRAAPLFKGKRMRERLIKGQRLHALVQVNSTECR